MHAQQMLQLLVEYQTLELTILGPIQYIAMSGVLIKCLVKELTMLGMDSDASIAREKGWAEKSIAREN